VKICLSREVADALGDRLAAVAPGCSLVCLEPDGSFTGDPTGVEVVQLPYELAQRPAALPAVGRLLGEPTLRWLQSPGAGVDHPAFAALLKRGIRVTHAGGVHAEPIAQYLFTWILYWERRVAEHQAQQRARSWQHLPSGDLAQKGLGIVGLGGIGAATARVARAFGMRVLGCRRTPGSDENVDAWFTPDRLHELLAASHYVVLSLPLTAETRQLIGAAELAAMRPDAVLLNVARGAVLDEAALTLSLQRGGIRGAVLDVASEEPLPPSSPLWDLPGCVVTPHDAGFSPLANQRIAELLLDNLARYQRDAPLRNLVSASELRPAQ
jgi:phosphoglycerate dehydrogenase-like enzyme